jgi:hypothetical protein
MSELYLTLNQSFNCWAVGMFLSRGINEQYFWWLVVPTFNRAFRFVNCNTVEPWFARNKLCDSNLLNWHLCPLRTLGLKTQNSCDLPGVIAS